MRGMTPCFHSAWTASLRVGRGQGNDLSSSDYVRCQFWCASGLQWSVDAYPGRELFPSAPLEFVAFEVRFPLAPRLESKEALEALADRLRERLPVPHEESVQTVTLGPGRPTTVAERRYRFTDRSRTLSAVIGRSAVSVETTSYSEFPDFRALVSEVLEAVGLTANIVGVERVGLRYIDEIRVPAEIRAVGDWRGWIADEVLGTLAITEGFIATQMQTLLQLVSDAGMITVRYAALEGEGVVGDGPMLRRSAPGKGPFFVIDSDSFWVPEPDDMMVYDPGALLSLSDRLHAPLGDLFHRAITDRLREELRKPR
jgi:uncharacterized protein (TIGR04255 family)